MKENKTFSNRGKTLEVERYYLVREDILPEAVLKTIQVKELLVRGEVDTVHEAVDRIGMSRSAFYKYKDGIFPLNQLERERIITISMDLEHRLGVLSNVLGIVAHYEGNVLTINQSIPLQGMANVVISVETAISALQLGELINQLREQDGVKRAAVIGQG